MYEDEFHLDEVIQSIFLLNNLKSSNKDLYQNLFLPPQIQIKVP